MRRYRFNGPRKPLTRKGKINICIVFILIGMIFLTVGGFFLGLLFREKAVCSFETKGEVVELVERNKTNNKGRERKSYAAVYSYEFEGKTYKYQSSVYSLPAQFSVGEKVTVMVNPDDPNEIYVPESNVEWILGWIIAGVGILITSVFIFLLIKTLREGRAPLTVEDELSQYQQEEQYYSDPDDQFKWQ